MGLVKLPPRQWPIVDCWATKQHIKNVFFCSSVNKVIIKLVKFLTIPPFMTWLPRSTFEVNGYFSNYFFIRFNFHYNHINKRLCLNNSFNFFGITIPLSTHHSQMFSCTIRLYYFCQERNYFNKNGNWQCLACIWLNLSKLTSLNLKIKSNKI